DVPRAVRRTKHREVGLSVAVVITGKGYVSRVAPLGRHCRYESAGRRQHKPVADSGAIDGEVEDAIAVVIARDGAIAELPAERGYGDRQIVRGRLEHPPLAGGRGIHSRIGLSVEIELADAPREAVPRQRNAEDLSVPRSNARRRLGSDRCRLKIERHVAG